MCQTQYSTGGSISAQSSQEECPEAMVDLDGAELARNHTLLMLEKSVDAKTCIQAYVQTYTIACPNWCLGGKTSGAAVQTACSVVMAGSQY